MAITTSRLMPFNLFDRSSSFDLPSGLITDLSKSNSTSAAKVTFSATGLGLAGSGAGLAAGAGAGFAGAGAGAGVGAGAGAGAGASCVAQPAANATAANHSQKFRFMSFPPSLSEYFFGSRVCMILEGILPYPPTSVQNGQCFRQQRAAL